jgi:hypothetical protein
MKKDIACLCEEAVRLIKDACCCKVEETARQYVRLQDAIIVIEKLKEVSSGIQ